MRFLLVNFDESLGNVTYLSIGLISDRGRLFRLQCSRNYLQTTSLNRAIIFLIAPSKSTAAIPTANRPKFLLDCFRIRFLRYRGLRALRYRRVICFENKMNHPPSHSQVNSKCWIIVWYDRGDLRLQGRRNSLLILIHFFWNSYVLMNLNFCSMAKLG